LRWDWFFICDTSIFNLEAGKTNKTQDQKKLILRVMIRSPIPTPALSGSGSRVSGFMFISSQPGLTQLPFSLVFLI